MRLSAIIALLLAVTAAHAALSIAVVQHNTDVQSTYSSLKACSCGSTMDKFTVKNIGQLESIYTFTLEADKSWFYLEKTWVSLKPGESTDISVITNAPCGATDTGHYTVYIASEYGRYRAIDKNVESGVCENIQWDLTPLDATIQPCDSQSFKLTITNAATFREHYIVDGLGFGNVTLDGGESAILNGKYTASCSEWGDKTIPVTIKAENNDRQDKKEVLVHVPRAYDFTVELGDVQKPVCAAATSIIPVKITNTEDRGNTFTLQGEPWMNTSSVYVKSGATRTTTLDFTPAKSGDRDITVTVKGNNGSIEKKASTTIPVEACYGFTEEASNTVNTCPGNVYIPFSVTSKGTQQQTLSFDVLSNTSTSIDDRAATLNPGQQLEKTVRVTVPDADRQYYVTLVANSTNANTEATTTVNAYSTESCYKVAPDNTKFTVWTDQTMLPIIIKQTGIQPATYTVQYFGDFMRPQEQTISLSPDGKTILHFNVSSAGYSTGRYVNRLVLTTAGVQYTTDFEIQLRQKGFWENFLDACKWNGSFGVCSVTSSASLLIMVIVILLLIGIMIGLVHYENPANFSRETAGIIGSAILIILLVAMIMAAPQIPRTYERPVMAANESALYYEVGAGQTTTINVSKFFYSPDNKTLSFTASQSPNLQVRLQNGIATIKANDDYRGEQTLVFTANDGNGGITDSDLFHIYVVPFKPVNFLQYWQYACWFMTFLFLFIAVLLCLLTVVFVKEVRPVRESKHVLVLYKRPKAHIVQGHAQSLVEQADTSIQNLPPGTTIGQVIGTQVIQQPQQEQLYVASTEGIKFHHIKCPFVKAMPKDKRLTFSSKEDAIKAGYTPCKTCSSHS